MDCDLPANIIVVPCDIPGDDSCKSHIVLKGEPFVVVRPDLIRQCLLGTTRVFSISRYGTSASRRAMKHLRATMSHSRLFPLSISCNAITSGVTVRDNDATRDIPERTCLVCEFSSRDDVPWAGEICRSNGMSRNCRLRLIGLKSEPVNSWSTDDAAAQRQSNGVHQNGGILEIANEFRCRRATVCHWDRFTECRTIRRTDSLNSGQRFRPRVRCILLNVRKLPEISSVNERKQPESLLRRDSNGRNRPRCQRVQTPSNLCANSVTGCRTASHWTFTF